MSGRWTLARIADLTRRWLGHEPAARIAEALGGVSKNAVVGKAHRLGLPPNPGGRTDPEFAAANSARGRAHMQARHADPEFAAAIAAGRTAAIATRAAKRATLATADAAPLPDDIQTAMAARAPSDQARDGGDNALLKAPAR